jgi:hypothetical protein
VNAWLGVAAAVCLLLAEPAAAGAADAAALAERLARLRDEAQGVEPAAAPDQQRIEALEREIALLEEELRRLADEARQTANALAALSQESERIISLTVYGNLDASRYQGDPAILDARTFELVLSGHPHKRLSFIAQVEFERAAGVGDDRGGEVVVEQAYVTLGLWPWLDLRAGAFFVPFGFVGVDHFPPKRDVVTRPLTTYVVVPGDWTDNGVGLYGKRLVGENWLLSYEAYLLAGLDSDVSALGLRRARQGYGVDNNGDKALAGRLALNRSTRLQVGLSGYSCEYDDAGEQRLNGWALDAVAQAGPLKLTVERDSFTAPFSSGPRGRWRGHYARLVYDFGRSFLQRTALGRDFEEPRLSLVLQHDRVAIDAPGADGFARNRERRLTAGLNVRPSTQWVLKLGYEWNATTGQPLVNGDKDGWLGSIGFIF